MAYFFLCMYSCRINYVIWRYNGVRERVFSSVHFLPFMWKGEKEPNFGSIGIKRRFNIWKMGRGRNKLMYSRYPIGRCYGRWRFNIRKGGEKYSSSSRKNILWGERNQWEEDVWSKHYCYNIVVLVNERKLRVINHGKYHV